MENLTLVALCGHITLVALCDCELTSGDTKTPVTVHSEAGQQRYVLLVLVVGVAGHIPVGPVLDDPLPSGEHVPDAQSLPVLVPAPLHLTS